MNTVMADAHVGAAVAQAIAAFLLFGITVIYVLYAKSAAASAKASTAAIKTSVEAQLLSEFLYMYRSDEMSQALRTVREWRERFDTPEKPCAAFYADQLRQGHEEADLVDKAKRHITTYFLNAYRLFDAGFVSEEWLLAATCRQYGIAILLEDVWQMELALNPLFPYEDAFIALRDLCPGTQPADDMDFVPPR